MGWLSKKDPLINKVYSVIKYFPEGIPTDLLLELSYSVSKTYDDYAKLIQYISVPEGYLNYCKIIGTIDPYTEYLCKELHKYLNAWSEAKAIASISPHDTPNKTIIATVVMKTKAYRISPRAYRDIKNNKLLKVLCKK
jgi:hypothetical protein